IRCAILRQASPATGLAGKPNPAGFASLTIDMTIPGRTLAIFNILELDRALAVARLDLGQRRTRELIPGRSLLDGWRKAHGRRSAVHHPNTGSGAFPT